MQNDWNHKKSTVNGMIFFPHMIFFIFVKRPARGRAGFGPVYFLATVAATLKRKSRHFVFWLSFSVHLFNAIFNQIFAFHYSI